MREPDKARLNSDPLPWFIFTTGEEGMAVDDSLEPTLAEGRKLAKALLLERSFPIRRQ